MAVPDRWGSPGCTATFNAEDDVGIGVVRPRPSNDGSPEHATVPKLMAEGSSATLAGLDAGAGVAAGGAGGA